MVDLLIPFPQEGMEGPPYQTHQAEIADANTEQSGSQILKGISSKIGKKVVVGFLYLK